MRILLFSAITDESLQVQRELLADGYQCQMPGQRPMTADGSEVRRRRALARMMNEVDAIVVPNDIAPRGLSRMLIHAEDFGWRLILLSELPRPMPSTFAALDAVCIPRRADAIMRAEPPMVFTATDGLRFLERFRRRLQASESAFNARFGWFFRNGNKANAGQTPVH